MKPMHTAHESPALHATASRYRRAIVHTSGYPMVCSVAYEATPYVAVPIRISSTARKTASEGRGGRSRTARSSTRRPTAQYQSAMPASGANAHAAPAAPVPSNCS